MLVLKTGDAKLVVGQGGGGGRREAKRKKQQRYYSEHLMCFNFLKITVSDICERQNIFNLPASFIEILETIGA